MLQHVLQFLAVKVLKLYGLLLHHQGYLKNLGGPPCGVEVQQVGNLNDKPGQCFNLWNAGEKNYAECFLPPKRVSLCLFYYHVLQIQFICVFTWQ